MVDILLLQTVSIAIASASVVAGMIYYSLHLRHQTRLRQMDLVMRLYSTFSSDEFQAGYIKFLDLKVKDYDDFMKTNTLEGVFKVSSYFEAVGILLKMKIINTDLALRLFKQSVPLMWEKCKPIWEGLRKKYNQPEWVEWFEYLYNEMKKREQKLQQSKD